MFYVSCSSASYGAFKKACEDPDGEYGKYFYICDVVMYGHM